MPTPLAGNGIVHSSFSPLKVHLTLTPATNDGPYGYVGLGGFYAAVGHSPGSLGMKVSLNIFEKSGGVEKLVTTVELDKLAQIAQVFYDELGRPIIPDHGFHTSISDKNKFPNGLPVGSYRAEAVVYTLTPPISTTSGLKSESRWVEAGGAAVEFRVDQVNLVPVTEGGAGFDITATVSPKRGATKAQIDRLNAAARARVSQVYTAAKAVIDSQSRVVAGEPTRKPWKVSTNNSPIGLSASIGGHGQSYNHMIPQIFLNVGAVRGSGNTVVTTPDGNIVLKTYAWADFYGWVNGTFHGGKKQ